MYYSLSRHLLNLHSLQVKSLVKTALFAFFACATPFLSKAQVASKGNYNYLDFKHRNYYFGITLGYNQADYRIFRGKTFSVNDSFAAVEAIKMPGFNLSIVSNLTIGEMFDVRFLPGFSFANRTINYDLTRKNAKDAPKRIESVFVELPFHVRYKSKPYHDKRAFVTTGLKYAFDIQNKSRMRQSADLLRIAPADFTYELGAGVQMFFPFFIFSPEFKVSQGLGNVLIYKAGDNATGVLESLRSRTFTVSLHFEG